MTTTVYDKNTGQIMFTARRAEPTDITGTIEGNYPNNRYYIDLATHLPVDIPPKPADVDSVFNYGTKQWQIVPKVITEEEIRRERNHLLTDVDRVNPIWYNSLTSEQQAELTAYRQALLDITTQAGFPAAVVWPLKPLWL
jgi:hypothetical protein